MTDLSLPCSIISLPDIDLESQISCAKQRVVVDCAWAFRIRCKSTCCEVE